METEATKPAVFSLVWAGDGCEAGMDGMRLLAQALEARRPGLHKPTGCIKTESCGCLQETSLEDAETRHLNPPPALNQRPFEVQAYSVSCCHKTVLGDLFWRIFLKYSGHQCLLSRPGKRGLYSLVCADHCLSRGWAATCPFWLYRLCSRMSVTHKRPELSSE